MSELSNLVNRATFWQRFAVIALAVGLLSVGGLGWYAKHQEQKAKEQALLATEAGKREALWKEQAKAADELTKQAQVKVDYYEDLAARLQTKLDTLPKPPKPVPAPEQDEALATGLREAGLSVGLKVLSMNETAFTTFSHVDARRVWEWKDAAWRLAPTENRLDASLALNGALTGQVDALKDMTAAQGVKINALTGALSSCDERADALNREAKALKSSLQATKVQKWLMTGGAAVVSFYAGRKLR